MQKLYETNKINSICAPKDSNNNFMEYTLNYFNLNMFKKIIYYATQYNEKSF